jgi:hypothetical protein
VGAAALHPLLALADVRLLARRRRQSSDQRGQDPAPVPPGTDGNLRLARRQVVSAARVDAV